MGPEVRHVNTGENKYCFIRSNIIGSNSIVDDDRNVLYQTYHSVIRILLL